MVRFEKLTLGSRLKGLIANGATIILQTQWHEWGAGTLTYRDDAGRVGQEVV